ncbi:MAG: hypothetical protein ACRD2L_09370 [Terriglobia bacterium]
MKLDDITDLQTLRAQRARALAALASPLPIPPLDPIGQDNHPDVALLMRHLNADHELECNLPDHEIEFMGSIWTAIQYERDYWPTEQELVVVRALNRKMAGCLYLHFEV